MTNVEACLNRLREEVTWLSERGILVPVANIPANYISRLDSQFWCNNNENNGRQVSTDETALDATLVPPKLCSKWVRQKSQQLAVSFST